MAYLLLHPVHTIQSFLYDFSIIVIHLFSFFNFQCITSPTTHVFLLPALLPCGMLVFFIALFLVFGSYHFTHCPLEQITSIYSHHHLTK